MKNPFKKKSKDAPRPLDEIQKEWQQLSAAAANVQYRIFICTEELRQINHKLLSVNQEAEARDKLDKEVKAAKGATNE